MKITYNYVIKTLKFVTTTAFLVALGFKLYNIYKYGGPKKPDKPIERDDDESPYEGESVEDYPNAVEETEAYDSDDYAQDKEYTEN